MAISQGALRQWVHLDTVRRWRGRYADHGIGGLKGRPRTGRPPPDPGRRRAQTLAARLFHQARVFGRCSPKTGINPFMDLVEQVMTQYRTRRSATVTFRYNPLHGDAPQHQALSAGTCANARTCLNRKLSEVRIRVRRVQLWRQRTPRSFWADELRW